MNSFQRKKLNSIGVLGGVGLIALTLVVAHAQTTTLQNDMGRVDARGASRIAGHEMRERPGLRGDVDDGRHRPVDRKQIKDRPNSPSDHSRLETRPA